MGSRPIALAVWGRETPNAVGLLPFSEKARSLSFLGKSRGAMTQILTQMPLLFIFDNFENVLSKGRTVREGQSPTPSPKACPERSRRVGGGPGRGPARERADEIADPALASFFEQLVKSVAQGSRFLFTTRYDFDPARGRLTGEIEHISLGELPFPMAVQCMNNHDALAPLPVVPPPT